MPTEILPIDVVDHILSFLRSDIASLKTCAQSHPTLSKLSERYIYAKVALCAELQVDDRIHTSTEFTTSEFAQILADTSDVANHVRTLTVVCIDERRSQQHEASASHLNGVASLLPMFTGLTSLTIRGRCGQHVAWDAMPETFHQAFLHYLQSQVMKEVVLCLVSSFPLSLLNNCTNIRATLEDCETQYDDKSSPEGVLRSYGNPFEHLSIVCCFKRSSCLGNIASWVKMHGLRSLKYVINDSSDSPQQLLVACSNSLTNLGLDILKHGTSYQISNDSTIHPNEDIAHLPLFTLASLHHLTQLTVDTNSLLYCSADGCWTLVSPIPTITELVSTARPTLKTVSIKIHFTILNIGQSPDPVVIWFPFIPLADKCSSASISIYISPSFENLTYILPKDPEFTPDSFSPLADYKGLTPYVQSGVVVISDGCTRGRR